MSISEPKDHLDSKTPKVRLSCRQISDRLDRLSVSVEKLWKIMRHLISKNATPEEANHEIDLIVRALTQAGVLPSDSNVTDQSSTTSKFTPVSPSTPSEVSGDN